MKHYYEVTIESPETGEELESQIRRAIREYIEGDDTFLVDVELTDTKPGDMPAFIGLDYAEYTALRSLANLLPAIGKA
jgi:hypothetical protein